MKNVIILGLILSVFPVSISAATYTEQPTDDTWIWPGYGPYGSSTELRTNIDTQADMKVVLKWDISSIPAGSTIDAANIYVYRYDGWDDTGLTCYMYRVTQDWDESTLVDAIAFDNTTIINIIDITGNGWYDFYMAPLTQDWLDGTTSNYGVVFYGVSGTSFFQNFYSKEYGSYKPYLEIEYTPPVSIESTSLGGIKAAFK